MIVTAILRLQLFLFTLHHIRLFGREFILQYATLQLQYNCFQNFKCTNFLSHGSHCYRCVQVWAAAESIGSIDQLASQSRLCHGLATPAPIWAMPYYVMSSATRDVIVSAREMEDRQVATCMS